MAITKSKKKKELVVPNINTESDDIGLQILYQWFAGECLNQPVDTIIINSHHYNTLGGQKISELKNFLRNHGAVDYIQIVGTNEVPPNQVFTSAVGE